MVVSKQVRLCIVMMFFIVSLSICFSHPASAQQIVPITNSDRSISHEEIEAIKAKAKADVEARRKEQANKTGILDGYNSYDLYGTFLGLTTEYWNNFYGALDKTNALGILASVLITFSFCLLSLKLYTGKGYEHVIDGGISLGVAIASFALLTNKAFMDAIIFDFCLTLPLKISSFFMDVAGMGEPVAGLPIWEKMAMTNISSVKGLFDALDSGFSMVWEFWEVMCPEGVGVLAHIATFFAITFMLIMYSLIYVQFIITFIRCTCLIVICGIMAPFFGALATFSPARMKILSLAKTIFYNWLVMIISTIAVGLFMTVLSGMIVSMMEIEAGASIFVGSFIFTVLWTIIGYSLLAAVPSFVSQITEMRGASGGVGGLAVMGGAGYLAGKGVGIGKEGVKKLVGAFQGAKNRHRDRQKKQQQ